MDRDTDGRWLVWFKTKADVRGRPTPTGSESYRCMDTRRRYYGCLLGELQSAFRENDQVRLDFQAYRATRASGEDKYSKVEKIDIKTIVNNRLSVRHAVPGGDGH